MRRPACAVVLLLASLLGSTGTDLAPAPGVGSSPVDQGQAPSPPGPSFALGPVTLSSAPPASSASPPLQKGAASPAVPAEPAPVAPPKGSNAPPPVESVLPPVVSVSPPAESAPPSAVSVSPPAESAPPPAVSVSPPAESAPPPAVSVSPPVEPAPPPAVSVSPPVEPAPPPAVTEVVPPAAAPPPQATAGNPTPILPGSPALLPSVQAPAPSVAVKPNLPLAPPASLPSAQAPTPSVTVKPNVPLVPPPSLSTVQAPTPSVAVKPNVPLAPPPSVNNQPGRPIGSGNDVPPYPPPEGIFPAVPPSTSVPAEHVKPPISPPIIAHAPQQAQAPNAEHNSGNTVPPANTSPPASAKNHDIQRAPPPKEPSTAPVHKSPTRGFAPAASPLPHNTNMPTLPRNASTVPHAQPPSLGVAPKPAPTSRSHPPTPRKGERPSFSPSYPPPHVQGPEVSRAQPPQQVGAKRQNHHAPPPMIQGHPNLHVHPPSPPPVSPKDPSNGSKRPRVSPTLPPIPPETEPKAPSTHPIWTLPPPPPNLDCKSLVCPEPLTDPPAGAPCACVLPIKVGIRLSVDLYSFFPLVSDFADEVGSGVNMARRQVRVMGANVAGDQPDKTVVLVHLVPMHVNFDKATALSTFQSLWSKKISLKPSVFGDYEILYVVYPGLPPSPPSAPNAGAFGNSRNARAMKPLGVDVGGPKRKVNGSVIAIAVLSTVIALIICTVAAWLLILRFRDSDDMAQGYPHSAIPKISRSSGTCNTLLAGRRSTQSGPSSSLGSSMAAYAGQAKTFKFVEIEKATNGFDDSLILGEGGFGCVYQGTLEDGTTVAVKVLKRFDGQGEREFLAEVEMLGRLHHRNLVKLLGICVEENARCLVYELIPNGSVESHLHGADREIAPLDWNARMKIALGAGRALAYLHEDSSPCVIHRDFKSSNILLEHDFTPKVSDFGLARTARGEGNQHISTRVMGTFGYVAPEYAMTGHLLVKSDVYSYGVVLLELLTGRKPVDMSQPAGQESLVAWARPYLTNVVSLRQAVDPLLGPNVPLDNVAKAAAIASMCVQPEVAHRPSMSEVVQALKLVCSEGDEGLGSGSFSQELAARTTAAYDVTGMEAERVLLSEMFGSTPVFTPAADSGSFRMQSSSGPLMTGTNKKFWQRMRNLSRGSMSEHGNSPDFETQSQCSNR
ncbi:receptor-like serine/threonine-protein kinase ALE2 isoform X2 [Hordeum vulgare subsp. vulgare]|uniref:Protein kinase domain-containing protein n=1 Tax=Hordeum vulgare subsp. vulgare TaxID=112509 RepID=A0A8I6X3E3_HORVV|nr:receptor-like serine/threonine-protein kinase ALE2 isoform X2 [Hordeum vulgare subsp. vulgare]